MYSSLLRGYGQGVVVRVYPFRAQLTGKFTGYCSNSNCIASSSALSTQPFSSSTVTTSTLENSASKCNLKAKLPSSDPTTAGKGTPEECGVGDKGEG